MFKKIADSMKKQMALTKFRSFLREINETSKELKEAGILRDDQHIMNREALVFMECLVRQSLDIDWEKAYAHLLKLMVVIMPSLLVSKDEDRDLNKVIMPVLDMWARKWADVDAIKKAYESFTDAIDGVIEVEESITTEPCGFCGEPNCKINHNS